MRVEMIQTHFLACRKEGAADRGSRCGVCTASEPESVRIEHVASVDRRVHDPEVVIHVNLGSDDENSERRAEVRGILKDGVGTLRDLDHLHNHARNSCWHIAGAAPRCEKQLVGIQKHGAHSLGGIHGRTSTLAFEGLAVRHVFGRRLAEHLQLAVDDLACDGLAVAVNVERLGFRVNHQVDVRGRDGAGHDAVHVTKVAGVEADSRDVDVQHFIRCVGVAGKDGI